ncbi:STAS domain-containing protein [Aquimarina pacifica]|uniref:STAS domain-containing protein n=1 Tax=Aquimarina pacifica TaxID=1296415 RepID=UPI000471EABA|nr:STAS domain-containing protein [Aquimarina pacifica]
MNIRNNAGTYEVLGEFTSLYNNEIQEYFDYLLDHYQEIVMSLEKVKKIDAVGIETLNRIYTKATKRSKVLFVLGTKNTIVVNALKQNQLTHIFRNDY